MKNKAFVKYAWFAVFYLILVIVWGAIVRLTGSGAGCGAHWPQCNGELIPIQPGIETMIEFGHRITSGLSIFVVGALVYTSHKLFKKGHPTRAFAWACLFFLLLEAGIGAALVLNEWVAKDTSGYRAFMSAFHLSNTFFLLGCGALTATFAGYPSNLKVELRPSSLDRKRFLFIAGLLIAVGASGAIVALGDTLFPAKNLMEGIKQDFAVSSHFLIRLRILHPMMAVFSVVVLIWFARLQRQHKSTAYRLSWQQLELIAFAQIAIGILNWLLMAPTWLQIFHLVVADLLWIRFVTAGVPLFISHSEK